MNIKLSTKIIFALLFGLLLISPPTVAFASTPVDSDITTREVQFQGEGGLTMHGTVLDSTKAQPNRPGVVLIHGSGSGSSRTRLMPEATAFARQGLAVLIYDKRSVGYSQFERSYSQLATDALGAVNALRNQPGVDPQKVGLWGISEGGWVAPLAATRSNDVAFVIVVGANAMPPLQQQAWSDTSSLRRNGVSGSLVEQASPAMFRLLGDSGLFAEAYYDAPAALERLKQPLLGIWGTNDLSTPPGENPPLFAQALEKGGNSHYTFRFFEGADHAAHQTPDGGVTRLPILAPGYADAVGAWVPAAVAGQVQAAAFESPAQSWQSVPMPRSAWWESTPIHLSAVAIFVITFLGYPLIALIRRVRRHPIKISDGWGPRVLAGAGMFTVLGMFVYLIFLFTDGAHDGAQGPVIVGRPLPWLLLQGLAITTVVSLIVTAVSFYHHKANYTRGERIRLGLLLTGGIFFIPWAVYWGLLLP